MRPPPGPRRPPYWTLPAFAVLISVPFAWAAVALVAIMIGRLAVRAARAALERHSRRAAARAAGPGTVLGRDERGRPVSVADGQLAAHGLIVGATGAGKSTTLLGILTDRIERGLPVVALDLKGSPAFAAELTNAAERSGRPMRVWTLDGPGHWNPLAHGNPTELKDKLVATERFTEPHYKRAAERYVQTALGVLQASGHTPQLSEVVALMEPRRLAAVTRRLPDPHADRVLDYLATLSSDQLSAARGLGTRLALLTESSAGPYLAPGERAIDLRRALDGPEVVLFSLNSSVYAELAAQVATLAIQDLVSAAGHRLERAPTGGRAPVQATVAIDEFSAIGADHLLALLARGREPGVSVVLATQELADLERAGAGFRDQVLGLTAVKIAHRQDVHASAQLFAQMVGTERVWEVTHQIRSPFAPAGSSRGTRREAERFIVDPNEIKTLPVGHAVLLTKTPQARVTRVGITPPRNPDGGRAPRNPDGGRGPRNPDGGRGPRKRRIGRDDQAEPGVTR